VPPLPTTIGRRFDCGVFDHGRTTLFITPGAGESGPRARLFDPPEISLLHITF
jgi:predicted MPP superfamily phosphohydrolase